MSGILYTDTKYMIERLISEAMYADKYLYSNINEISYGNKRNKSKGKRHKSLKSRSNRRKK